VGLVRKAGRSQRGALSVDDGAIRGQHGAISEKCGAIRKRNESSSIELEAIHERCGVLASKTECDGNGVSRIRCESLSVGNGAIRWLHGTKVRKTEKSGIRTECQASNTE